MKKKSSNLITESKISNFSIFLKSIKRNYIYNILLYFLFVLVIGTGLLGQSKIGEGQVTVKGLTLALEPLSQTVPINTPTVVNTTFSIETPQVLKGMVIKADLNGPGLTQSLSLSTLPNHPFSIPGLSRKGDYYLENIRLEREGEIVLTAEDTVLIQVMDLIVTKVESRPLTLQEIREKGISITDDNFSVYNFSVGLLLNSEEVKYEFPVVYSQKDPYIPKVGSSGGGGGGSIGLPSKETIPFEIKPTVSSSVELDEDEVPTPKMTGILVFNNDVAFLNQFFSVMFIISNSAPEGSELTLKDLTASISFPEGLKEAETNPPHIPGTAIPISCPGPDKKLGTSDDLTIIMAGFSGMAEFLAEGLKEGTHYVTIDFNGTLSGLPSGDTPVKGTAKGAVIVRNPKFSITFSHPRVVRIGEEYDVYVTMTNTSPVAANLVSLTMPSSRIINCKLLSEETASFDTIESGQSETVHFRMESLQNGEVRASSFEADGNLVGKFVLTVGVGEEGIPLSPDTLVMPSYCYKLPNELLNALVISLGEAYSIATTPPSGVPSNLPMISRDTVTNRIVEMAEAGQRIQYNDSILNSIQVLSLDWLGNKNPDLPFDILRRMTSKGTKCSIQISSIFNQELSTKSPEQFQYDFAENCSYMNPYISAILSGNSTTRLASLEMTDFYENILAGPSLTDSELHREIPYAEIFQLEETNGSPIDFALIGNLEYVKDENTGIISLDTEKTFSIRVLGLDTGSFDLSFIVPQDNGTFKQVKFSDIPCQQGSVATFQLTFNLISENLVLSNVLASGAVNEYSGVVISVIEPPLQLLGAYQDCSAERAGRAIALFFNRSVSQESAKVVQNYSVEKKNVYAAFLQPSKRVILLGVDSAVSPLVDRKVTIKDLTDTDGASLSPLTQEKTIIATIDTPGGVVYGKIMNANGLPVPNAILRLGETESDRGLVNSYTLADSSGNYQFDFVRILDSNFEIEVMDPSTKRKEKINSRLRVNGQRLNLDMFMRGTGTIKGEVFFVDNVIPPEWIDGHYIVVYAHIDTGNGYRDISTKCSKISRSDGWHFEFQFLDVPLGAVSIRAVTYYTGVDLSMRGTYIGNFGSVLAYDGQTIFNANITINKQPTGSVSGCVLLSDGVTPVKGALVYVLRNGTSLAFPIHTNDRGNFSFPYISIGTINIITSLYSVNNLDGNLVAPTFTGQVSTDQVSYAKIILRGTSQISGTVMEYDGTPLSGAKTFVQNTNIIATSDENGHFLLENVPIGIHTLTTYLPDTDRNVNDQIELHTEGEVATINIVMPHPVYTGSIRGAVYDPNGQFMPYTEVRIYDKNNMYIDECETDELGNYQLDNIPVGGYKAVVNSGEGGAGVNQTVVQYPGHIAQADVHIKGMGSIKVNVYGSDGQSGVKASLQVSRPIFRENRGRTIGFTAETQYYTTDDNGKFTIPNVYLGSFSVKAWNGFYPQGSYVRSSLTANGEEKIVDLVMIAPGEVTVQVVSYDGVTVIPQAPIKFTANSLPLQNAVTDPETGLYTFSLVPPGNFIVEASHPIETYVGKASGVVPSAGGHVDLTVRLRGRGIVNVTVKNQSEQVIPNAQVSLRNIQFPYERFDDKVCNGNGFYSFNNISEGSFSVEAFDVVSSLGGRADGSVTGHGDVVEITVYLEASGSIAGCVFQPDEVTITPSAQIILYNSANSNPFGYITSDSSGQFRFDHVPHGSYRLEAYEPSSGRTGKSYISIQQEGEVAEANVRLEGRGVIEGYVYDGSGDTPIQTARIILETEGSFPVSLQSNTDQNGYYYFENINEGPFTLSATDINTDLWGKASGNIEYDGHHVSVNVILKATGTVSGNVFEADGITPVSFAYIQLKGSKTFTAYTSDSGRYTINNVPVGTFTISAKKNPGRNHGSSAGVLEDHGQILNVDIEMEGVGTVSGTVKDSSQNPMPNYNVQITNYGETFSFATDSYGAFQFSDICKGNFSIEAIDPVNPTYGLKAAMDGSIISDGQNVVINLILEDAGEVKGRVLKASDGTTPESNVYVNIKQENGTLNLFTITDENGNFQFKAVRLGTFVVKVQGTAEVGVAKRIVTITSAGDIIDLGDIIPDLEKPSVESFTPGPGVDCVDLTATVTVVFSEAMDVSTLTTSKIKLLKNGTAVAGTLSIAADQRSVTFTPSASLIGFSLYTIFISNEVTDSEGNPLNQVFSSTFTTVDLVPPIVSSVNPLNNQEEVSTSTSILVTFNEFINSAQFSSQNLTVTKNGIPITGTLEFLSEMAVQFTPSALLEENSVYQIEVSNAMDIVGNIQTQVFASSFKTIDTIAPTLTLSPLSGGTSVVEGSVITVSADIGGALDVNRVNFFKNGALSFTDSVSPYRYQLTAPLIAEVGNSFIVDAYAVDHVGNQSNRDYLTYTLISDGSPQITLSGPASTTVYPGDNLTFTVTANDDISLTEVTLTAIGGTLNHVDTRNISQASYTGSFPVTIPNDTLPSSVIVVSAEAKDTRSHVGTSQQLTLTVPNDEQNPIVNIDSPEGGELFKHNEIVTISATASDDVALKEVRIFLNNQLLNTLSQAPFVSTYTVPPLEADQPTEIKVEAEDMVGKISQDTVNIVLERLIDLSAPQVKIISPSNGTQVIPGEDIKIRMEATDDEGIDHLDIIINTQLLQSLTQSPYEVDYTIPNDATVGSTITIEVVATDFDDKTGTAQSVLEVVTGTILSDGTVIAAGDSTYDNQTIIINDGIVTINGTHTFANVLVKESGILTHSNTSTIEEFKLELNITGKLSVGESAKINVNSRGYLGGNQGDNNSSFGYTAGNSVEGGSFNNSGGSYGGWGGQVIWTAINGNGIYGSFVNPTHSGAGGGTSSTAKGGNGGGIIRLSSSEINNDGQISSNGGSTTSTGSGAGGSIRIETAILRGSGFITANGGSSGIGECGSGGGGRIAVYYENASDFNMDNITAYGGVNTGSSTRCGAAGTVYLQQSGQAPQLILDNNAVAPWMRRCFPFIEPGTITELTPTTLTDINANFMADSLVGMELIPDMAKKDQTFTIVDNTKTTITIDATDGDLTAVAAIGTTYCGMTVFGGDLLIRNSTLSCMDGDVRLGNLSILSGSHLTHWGISTTKEYYLSINVIGTITVDTNSSISANGYGYRGGRYGDNTSYFGYTLGNTTTGGSLNGSGGSHGGKGGQNSDYAVNSVYGSPYDPSYPGSGGGTISANSSGGSGGGVFRISCAELINNGKISVNGLSATTAGGGSGGSIKIETGILVGNGFITANGGNSTSYGAGGGGRIAIYYEDATEFNLENITAYGGNNTNSTFNGGAGTIYLEKKGETGEVIIDNNLQASVGGTPMLGGTSGIITFIEPYRLVDSNANFIPGSLVGLRIKPNINMQETYTIISNSQTDIFTDQTDGDMTLTATVGDTYGFKYTGNVILDGSQTKLSGSYQFSDITLINSALCVDGTLEVESLSLQNSSKIYHSTATTVTVYSMQINANEIIIDGGSSIDVSGCGYLEGYTAGNSVEGGSTNLSGGSYGGWGGQNVYGQVNGNGIYGSFNNPYHPGAGGGYTTSGSLGSNGGGVIRISSSEINNNGQISSNGVNRSQSGGGAGGSIRIDTGILKGSGFITANGANSGSYGAGGGGRIAVYYENASDFNMDNITAYGGVNTVTSTRCGAAGTVYLQQSGQEAQLILDNNAITSWMRRSFPLIGPGTITELTPTVLTDQNANFMVGSLIGMELIPDISNKDQTFTIVDNTKTTITIDSSDGDLTSVTTVNKTYGGKAVVNGHLIIRDTTNSSIDGDILVNNLSLLSGSSLVHSGATITTEYYLSLKVIGTITIDSTSALSGDSRGYRGGMHEENKTYFGYTYGNTSTGGSYYYSGGSYGGKGGKYNSNTVNEVYGSLYDPNCLGSGGGGASTNNPGGSGGGLLRIQCNELLNNGMISVNGRSSTSYGGGSGGSIKIVTGILSGLGSIVANGGSSYDRGAGGGGRIAIYYTDATEFNLDNISTIGGSHTNGTSSTLNGGAGTVYLKQSTATYGDLIISNNNVPCLSNTTPLPAVGQGFNTLLEANHMVNSTGTFIMDSLLGIKLNPQPSGSTLFTIISNNGIEIFTDSVDGDMTQVSSTGDPYIGEHLFYNVTIKGNAQVFTTDRIQVSGILYVEPGATIAAENIQ